ncbi:MAG: LLM class flavin-dependent oxidoreductase, partial [Pseudomonadota bacterium]
SGGRVRLGVGSGWQRSEYEALQEDFGSRGQRLDEAIELLRAYWRDEHITYDGNYYHADNMTMEPKPPQGGGIPIWIGGTKRPALRRVVSHGDGWMAMSAPGDPPLEEKIAQLHQFAEEAERDIHSIGMQMSLSPDALNKEERKRFYADPKLMLQRCESLAAMGFDTVSIDCVPIFQKGYRTVDAMLDYLAEIHHVLQPVISQPA